MDEYTVSLLVLSTVASCTEKHEWITDQTYGVQALRPLDQSRSIKSLLTFVLEKLISSYMETQNDREVKQNDYKKTQLTIKRRKNYTKMQNNRE